MPFNGSGVFTRLENWSNDASNNLPISATKFDIEDNDFAGGFDLCLTRDGQGAPSAPLTWAQQLTLTRGSDGQLLGLARTGGANNPALQFSVADVGGFTINTSIATGIALAIAGVAALSINSARNLQIGPPASGVALSIAGLSTQSVLLMSSTGAANNSFFGWNLVLGSAQWAFGTQGSDPLGIGTSGSAATTLYSNGIARVAIASTGAVTVNTPTSGIALTVNGVSTNGSIRGIATVAGSNSFVASPGSLTGVAYSFDTNGTVGIYQSAVNNFDIGILGAHALNINATGNWTLGAPSSGTTLTVNGGVNAIGLAGQTTGGQQIGITNTGGQGVMGVEASVGGTLITGTTAYATFLASNNNTALDLGTNGNIRVSITGAGNVTLNAPTSGVPLTVNGVTGQFSINATVGPIQSSPTGASTAAFYATPNASTQIAFFNSSASAFTLGFVGLSTGTAVEVLTANKPGTTTGIVGWLSVNNNGAQGWIPVWGN